MTFYNIAITIFRFPLLLLYRIKVINPGKEPKTPFIVYANHTSYSDPLVIAAALKSNLRFVARSSLIRFKFFNWFFKRIKAITINRNQADTSAIKSCVQAIKDGECVAIFPQGTRMPLITPSPEQAEAGLALIASMSNAVMLPVSLVTKKNHVKMFRRTYVVIGDPIQPAEYMNQPAAVKKKQISENLFKAVCDNYREHNK